MAPPSLAHHFLTEAYQNALANHRLLKACGRLTQADFVAARTSFFPSIKATLNHILTVDWLYRLIAVCAADFAELGFTEEAIWGERERAPKVP